jgi:ferrochelatase
MPCANDHPEFMKMAAEWANPQIEALLNETALAVNLQLASVQAKEVHSHSHGDHHHHHDHSHGDHHHHQNGARRPAP